MNQVFRRCLGAADKAGRTRDLLAHHGIACPTITAAGTGTFESETASGVYTELQCGSYIFMDADYGRNRDRDGQRLDRSPSDARSLTGLQPLRARFAAPPPRGAG